MKKTTEMTWAIGMLFIIIPMLIVDYAVQGFNGWQVLLLLGLGLAIWLIIDIKRGGVE